MVDPSDAAAEPAANLAASPGDAQPAPRGAAVIAAYVRTLPNVPGVYRMLDAEGGVLYVGKARDLKKRVANYTSPDRLNLRLNRMVAATVAMEFVTTHTEVEALLLESNLIKRLKPRYNILLRDDKSFPAILLTGDHAFPQVLKHRGAHSRKGEYFGPFASGWAVNKTLAALQRAFLLRTCSDAVFQARTRPCLLHQIKRCSAPCVGRVSAEDYAVLVAQARAFLSGGSQDVQRDLAGKMEEASAELRFEDAAIYRDRVRALTAVQSQQDINLSGIGDADVIAAEQVAGTTAVQVFFFRGGCNYGNRVYFPQHGADEEVAAVLEAFIGQFYARHPPPPLVLTSQPLPNADLAQAALTVRAARPVRLHAPQRGTKLHLINLALINARDALSRRLAESASYRRLLEGLAGLLDLDAPPARIEVYDNSHVAGTDAVGAMIVSGPDGLIRNAYRKFTIRGAAITPGDDYAMMREVLRRRFGRALAEDPERTQNPWPDLVLIDGGAGQLNAACEVLDDLGLHAITLAAIAKGPERNAGRERIFLRNRPPLQPQINDPVLHFLQRLRDEAHRFVIGTHRARRSARLGRSQLDEIPGIGAHRKKALLHHFGSAQAVAAAGCPDLEAVPGISRAIAKKIYDWFHPQG
ncbi:MAG: excinuclease ABC subunit UvrC [Defluviicoccus sp.]|nr:excinuclease ABC subunit UvrC [Defluviicoccus sp.]MDG4607778.1 excinuclease ABC subunit UvrC [Defluviicoccus sp.]